MTDKAQYGQFGVVRTKGWVQAVIRLATRSQVNHAFVVVSDTEIVEAQGQGAIVSPLVKYANHEVAYSSVDLTQDEADSIVAHARACVGTPYNFLDIAAIFLLLLGLRWQWLIDRAANNGKLICSQLVDVCYHAAGVELIHDGRPTGEVTPGDLLMFIAMGKIPDIADDYV